MKLSEKKVLVTGACGFIGSHLVEHLLEEGCRVKAFVFYNSFNSWGWLDSLPKKKLKEVEVVTGDIRDPHGLSSAVGGSNIVFHLAALIGIPFSYYSPDSYIDTNIKGTLNVLQACRDRGVEKTAIVSSSEVYGSAMYAPIDEGHPKQAQSPYSASKIGADAIAESFYRSFGLPVTIIRPFNTYGPRQSARAVIPTIVLQLLAGRKEIELGNIHSTRDLVYVFDVVQGFVEIMRSDTSVGEQIHIATGSEISIQALAQKLIAMINPRAKIVCDKKRLRPKDSEVDRLVGSNAKIKKLTRWAPKFSLEEGLKETVEWFSDKDNNRSYKSDVYNI